MELDPRLGATGDRASALANFGAEVTSRPSPVHHVPHRNMPRTPPAHRPKIEIRHNIKTNSFTMPNTTEMEPIRSDRGPVRHVVG
ncbi:hypothetical protein LB505_004717 [Fusarium chuoi]|nr:hypothetical protein LB505_004717 [Fusarium chuoi]